MALAEDRRGPFPGDCTSTGGPGNSECPTRTEPRPRAAGTPALRRFLPLPVSLRFGLGQSPPKRRRMRTQRKSPPIPSGPAGLSSLSEDQARLWGPRRVLSRRGVPALFLERYSALMRGHRVHRLDGVYIFLWDQKHSKPIPRRAGRLLHGWTFPGRACKRAARKAPPVCVSCHHRSMFVYFFRRRISASPPRARAPNEAGSGMNSAYRIPRSLA